MENETELSLTYEQAGVNIELGDDLSRTLYEAAKLTWDNRKGSFGELQELHKSFSGFRAMPAEMLGNTEDVFLGMNDDGVGTKVEVAERMADHSTVAFDLFAMVCDDAVVRGAEPIAVTTTLDVKKLDDTEFTRNSIRQLAEGYVRAANAAGVAVINGEVAELGDRIGGFGSKESDFNYNWSATVLWAANKDRIITGHGIKHGDTLIGLAEHGFRSNGISLVRKILKENLGDNWHMEKIPELEDAYLGQLVQAPSIIYSKFITELTGGFNPKQQPKAEISGVAHITGGGLPGKLSRMLEPSGFGAVIDHPFQPPPVMELVKDLGNVSDQEAYKTWNMGQGMVIATPEPKKVLELAEERNVSAQEIGIVTNGPNINVIRGITESDKLDILKF